MSYSGEAADQVVRLSLNGVEVAAKLSGSAAKQLAIMIYAILKDQKKTKGKIRLTNMLRSGKELKVFAVKDGDLQKFCEEAKKYGVLYCVLKDKNATDGITDIMVRAEDAAKVNRIIHPTHRTSKRLPMPENVRKGFRRYSCAVFTGAMILGLTMPAYAANDPLTVVNNLSTFIFGLIRAVGLILLGWGIVQVGLSLQSHDPSQRSNGFLTLAGGIVITFAKEILDLIVG